MKKMLFLLCFSIFLFSCSSDDNTEPAVTEVDPSDRDLLAQSLIIANANVVSGTPPAPSSSSSAPVVSNNQSSARITNDNTLILPFSYNSTTFNGYGGCYIQVNGASTYWNVLGGSNNPQNGQVLLPVGIPSTVLDGNFTISYCIYDADGRVSNILQTNVTIAPPKTCPGNERGSDGLTIFEYDLGNTPGNVTVDYNTYTIPDRVDIFYDGQWVDGTGSALPNGSFPPQLNCTNASPNDGFVGARGSFTVNHNGNSNATLKVYVSGCIGSSTAWDIQVSCPN